MKAGSKGRKEEEARKGGMEGRKVREGRMERRKEGRKEGWEAVQRRSFITGSRWVTIFGRSLATLGRIPRTLRETYYAPLSFK